MIKIIIKSRHHMLKLSLKKMLARRILEKINKKYTLLVYIYKFIVVIYVFVVICTQFDFTLKKCIKNYLIKY